MAPLQLQQRVARLRRRTKPLRQREARRRRRTALPRQREIRLRRRAALLRQREAVPWEPREYRAGMHSAIGPDRNQEQQRSKRTRWA